MPKPKPAPGKTQAETTPTPAAGKATAKKPTPKKSGKASKPKAKATKPPAAAKLPATPIERTPEEQAFQEKLHKCLPQERDFIKHKLARRNNTEAAILAGYSERTAEVQGAQLLSRLRVREAYNAGLDASDLGPKAVLDDIRALRTFDRSQIEREVKVRTTQVVQRLAEVVVQELITRERVTQNFIQTTKMSEQPDEALLKLLQRRLNGMLLQRLELEEQIALDPQCLTAVEVEEVVTKRVIDYDLAKERGLLRFIKGVKPSKFGDIIELHDWVDAVDMAARTHGLFKERHELTGKDGGPIEADFKGIEALSGAALMDRYKTLLGSESE